MQEFGGAVLDLPLSLRSCLGTSLNAVDALPRVRRTPASATGGSPDPFWDDRTLWSKRGRLLQPVPTVNNVSTMVKADRLASSPIFVTGPNCARRPIAKREVQAAPR